MNYKSLGVLTSNFDRAARVGKFALIYLFGMFEVAAGVTCHDICNGSLMDLKTNPGEKTPLDLVESFSV